MGAAAGEGIEAAVRAKLEADGVDALAIDITVRDGCVELRGEVLTRAERLAAGMLAAEVVAKDAVRNLLTVSPSGLLHELDDARIAEDVATAVARAELDVAGVSFDVSQHVVTIRGAHPHDHARARLRHVVAGVPGVHIVRDLTVTVAREDVEVDG